MPKQVLLFAALFMSLCFLGCNTTAQNNTTFAPVDYDQAFKLGQMVTFRHSGAYIEPIPKERFLTGATKSRCSVFVEKWQIFAIFSVKASFSPHLF